MGQKGWVTDAIICPGAQVALEGSTSGNPGTIYNHKDLGNVLLAQQGTWMDGRGRPTRTDLELIMAC
jgi:hypothetical protein